MTFDLSTFEGVAGLRVLRTGSFEVTGKLSTPLDGLCVPLRAARYAGELNAHPRVSAVITRREMADLVDERFALAVADDPDEAHSEIHVLCAKARQEALRGRPTIIDPSAEIDGSAHVSAHGVSIGAGVRILPGVTILPGVAVEDDCVLHPGVVLGTPAFNTGIIGSRRRIIPHLGGVRLKRGAELLSNTCVACALFGGETVVGEETITDNLVYIAHDVQIGRRVQICALAQILGRAVVGDEAYIGPSAVVVNGGRIGRGAKVTMGAVVTREAPDGATVSGNFAIEHERFLAHLRQIR